MCVCFSCVNYAYFRVQRVCACGKNVYIYVDVCVDVLVDIYVFGCMRACLDVLCASVDGRGCA